MPDTTILELNAKIRETLGKKVKTLRKKGIIPAILYGTKIKSVPLEVDYKEFEKVYTEAGESTIIKLKIGKPVASKSKQADQPTEPAAHTRKRFGRESESFGKEAKNVLIYDVVKDPITDKFVHVDFYAVRMDKLITTEVPLIFEGESPAVETEEGVLIKSIIGIEVEALPADLPHEIRVDISTLKTFDDSIHIKDLKVSESVKILAEPEKVVASVTPPRSEEELAALEEKVEEEVEEVEKVGEEEEGEEEEALTPEEVRKEPKGVKEGDQPAVGQPASPALPRDRPNRGEPKAENK